MNRAERIAQKIRAKARRAETKRIARAHKREDFRAQILAAILDAELMEADQ